MIEQSAPTGYEPRSGWEGVWHWSSSDARGSTSLRRGSPPVKLIPTLVLLVSLAFAAPLACGGHATTSSPSEQAACHDLAAAQCKQLIQCGSSLVPAYFGSDGNACIAQVAAACMATYWFPGSGATSASLEACASATRGASCDSYGVSLPLCPLPPGTFANGAWCSSNAQCAGGECSFAAAGYNDCGSCVEKTSAAPPCRADVDCVSPQICKDGGICALGSLGSACSVPGALSVCDSDLICAPTGVAGSGVCSHRPQTGESCAAGNSSVNCASGATCNSSEVCEAIQFAPLGQKCDPTGEVFCSGGIGDSTGERARI
jgi:hypothetical protein